MMRVVEVWVRDGVPVLVSPAFDLERPDEAWKVAALLRKAANDIAPYKPAEITEPVDAARPE